MWLLWDVKLDQETCVCDLKYLKQGSAQKVYLLLKQMPDPTFKPIQCPESVVQGRLVLPFLPTLHGNLLKTFLQTKGNRHY